MKTSSLALVLFATAAVSTAIAQTTQVPNLLSYQANVTNASGTPIGNTEPVNRTVTFKFYSAATGGTPVYAESQVVTIANGDFSVLIGNGNGVSGLPGPIAPASPLVTLPSVIRSPLYIGITVDDGTAAADAEISPRQQLASAAFASRAQLAEGLVDGKLQTAMIADTAITTNKIGGNQVTTAKIADANITNAKLAAASVTVDKLDTANIGIWTPNGGNINRPTGNVGIGEANPGMPLNFASTLGNKISLFGSSGAHYGLGIQTNLLQLYTPNSSSDITLGYGSSASFTETMRVKGSGRVGIGTNNPSEKLHVAGGNVVIDNTENTFLSLLRAGGTARVDLCLASGSGSYSSSASANDTVIRAMTGELHLQSGAGGSGITIDTANRVGLSTANPVNTLDVRGRISAGDASPDAAYNGVIQLTRPTSANQYINFVRSGNYVWSMGYGPGSNDLGIGGGQSTDGNFNPLLRLNQPYQSVCINTTDGSAGKLNLNGIFAILGTRDGGSAAQVRMYYESGGRMVFDGNNFSQVSGWRGFSYDGDSNLDWRSDRRLKQDIVDAEPVLDRLLELPLRRYRWKGGQSANPEFGVIAQEVQPLFPDLVSQGDDGYLTVGNTSFGMIAVKGLQELKAEKDAEIDGLRGQLERKDAEIADLNARLSALEKLVTGKP